MSKRRVFEFVGTGSVLVSLDPADFRGMSVKEIEAELLRTLDGATDRLTLFPDDIAQAACELHAAG